MNYAKITKLTTSDRIKFEKNDVKAMIAALGFIFTNAGKYAVRSFLPSSRCSLCGDRLWVLFRATSN